MADPATTPRPFQIITKPIGPKCNLDCSYCYYLEKEKLYPGRHSFRMSDETLETYVRDYVAIHDRLGVPEIWFSWQGGEPTLLGLDFFRKVVEFQKQYGPAGKSIRNALQTNGTLLTEEWAAFFKENGFLIGISIDGPREIHDRYRVDKKQRPSFDTVMRGLGLLRDGGADFNTLTVVQRHNSRHPRTVYRFLKDQGAEFMQFIPIVERSVDGQSLAGAPQMDDEGIEAKVTPWSVLPNVYGDFLCSIFDDWIRQDVGKVFVQFFDVQLGLWAGAPAGLCWFAETCGQGLAMEHNGDLYACDHYVYPEYRLGNINDTPMDQLAFSPEQVKFGQDKKDTLPRYCRECEYRFACNGGCPKHRFLTTPHGEDGLNYFCASYKKFFAHAGPRLRTMANLVHQGRPASDIMEMLRREKEARSAPRKVGRNDPCPCGSGRKFKACCGATKGRAEAGEAASAPHPPSS